MDSLLHGDERLDEMSGPKDREISLGTTMILGIFFALAVLCAVFFGFGYSLGRKSVVVTAGPAVPAAPATSVFAGFKPSSGSAIEKAQIQESSSPVSAPAVVRASNAKVTEADASVVGDDEAPAARVASTAPAAAVGAGAAAGGSAMVQVAAVSHQEDADLLLTTLKRRGYAVAVRSEPQDKLLHVQVGPFATHKDADAMRQRLLADGFNAIVKDSK